MARPKGVKQKRNESKYWLPTGIILQSDQIEYNKDTKLIFIDSIFGEFVSSFKALQTANSSTHPLSIQERRNKTNLERYGTISPAASNQLKDKVKQTMLERYGVENASQIPEIKEKKKLLSLERYGVENPMQSKEVKEKQQESCFRTNGVYNPMHSDKIKSKLQQTCLDRYGVTNAGGTIESKIKILESLTKNSPNYSSKGENEIREFVKSLGLNGESGYIGGSNPKQLDIKIKELNIGIEYNGLYWHSEQIKTIYPNYHKDKMLAAKEQGYRLIQIFEHEWRDKQHQVKSFLKSALGKNSRIIYGRNTEILEIPKKEAQEFLKSYHILGAGHFIKAFGLKLDNELLCLIAIGKHHRNSNEFVLTRFVGKEDINVIGGLSKLTSHAIKEFGQLTTWIDLRFSDGSNWLKSGWQLVKTLNPDYFYYNIKNLKIISKQSRKKSNVNTPVEMTEHEHALKDGLRRIYDCGKLKLLFK